MTVRDVLYECACILGDTEFAIDLKLHDELINDETERKYKVMLSSFNAIVNEVAISYLAPTTYKPFDSKTINTNIHNKLNTFLKLNLCLILLLLST